MVEVHMRIAFVSTASAGQHEICFGSVLLPFPLRQVHRAHQAMW